MLWSTKNLIKGKIGTCDVIVKPCVDMRFVREYITGKRFKVLEWQDATDHYVFQPDKPVDDLNILRSYIIKNNNIYFTGTIHYFASCKTHPIKQKIKKIRK